ncbi:MAG TPA: GDSL-type esterase/lipase family protein [Vicinamibacterales bacterium]|nr:GDSL-type esterase/lipase family protein [Vicinamibacterales bacterium]
MVRTSAIGGLLLAAACGGSPAAPTPVLALTCPARVEASTTAFDGAAVSFDTSTQGGRPPASVVCAPGSGSTFPIGETIVSCTATDTAAQTAGCSFPVSVTRTPTLAWTRFLAFGDSITEGVTSPAPELLTRLATPEAYPGQLQQMLAARYTAQEITVLNRGIAGERLAEGVRRLPRVLDEDQPDVLLLLEGVNNIRNVSTDELADDLDEMVRSARRRGVEVVLATLLPVSDSREAGRPGTQRAIRELNEEILRIARRHGLGAPADLYNLFLQTPSLLGRDGLHPTAEGYVRMAEVFFEVIRERYEDHAPAAAISTVTIIP